MFRNTSQVDVVSVLLLLGEATIWNIVWGRSRSRRTHISHFLFAISPGWAPFAGTIFAALQRRGKSPNLIYDRPPEGQLEDGLLLTNLNSGATHGARNTILQNIWQTWIQEQRRQRKPGGKSHDLTKRVGVIEVNLDLLHLECRSAVYIHVVCLAMQFGGSLVISGLTRSSEVLVTLIVALVAQTFLLQSIKPSEDAWSRVPRAYRSSPVMLHKGLDSLGVLIVKKAETRGVFVNLEEYCWDTDASKSLLDDVKLVLAGLSFGLFILQVILVGWMETTNRVFYLALGLLGLIANLCEAVIPSNWSRARLAYTGISNCSPEKSSLMSAVALVVAGRYPAADEAAHLLYPRNDRFARSLRDISTHLDGILCRNCVESLGQGLGEGRNYRCERNLDQDNPLECSGVLAMKAREVDSKQLSDGLAAVCHQLCWLSGAVHRETISTHEKIATAMWYNWK